MSINCKRQLLMLAQVMSELRAIALAFQPANIGLTPSHYAHRLWGVLLMESRLRNGAVQSRGERSNREQK